MKIITAVSHQKLIIRLI